MPLTHGKKREVEKHQLKARNSTKQIKNKNKTARIRAKP